MTTTNDERQDSDATPDRTALQDPIAGDVVLPGSTVYDELPRTFNARFHDVGAYSRVRPDATAFVHLSERSLLKHAAVVDPTSSAGEKEAAKAWASRSWACVRPHGSGRVFPNFADPDVED